MRRLSRRTYLVVFTLCLLLLASGKMYAQEVSLKTYNARTFYEDNGLASNEVYALTQSPNGEIWFGTKKGISTFDGLRWQHIAGSDSFHFHITSKLLTFGDSILQISGKDNYLNFRLHYKQKAHHLTKLPQSFTSLSHPARIAAERTATGFNFAVRIENHLWTLNYPNGKWKDNLLPEKLQRVKIHKIIYFQANLLLLTDQGLYRYDSNKNRYSPLWPSTLSDKTILAATTSSDGKNLYLLGDDWVGEWKDNRFRFLIKNIYPVAQAAFSYDIYNILSTRSGFILFQHRSSVFLLNPKTGTVEPIRLNHAGTTATPTSLMEDSEGNIWIATLRGASVLTSLRFATLDQVKGLPDTEVSTILPLDSTSVLLGSNIGVNILTKNNWVLKASIDQQHLSENQRILDALKTTSGQVFVAGNSSGLGVLNTSNQLRWYKLPEGLYAVSLVHWKGSIHVGTQNGKILRFANGRFTTALDLKQPIYLRKIYINSSGSLNILTIKGLFIYDGETSKQIVGKNHALSNLYSQISWKGRMLLGSTAGLAELKGDEIVAVTDSLLTIKRPVYALMKDAKSQLWIGTDKGVFVHKGNRLYNYNQQHGMLGQEVNRSALVEMPDGRIWIGTDKGLSIYDPQFEHERSIVPLIRLTSIKSDEQSIPLLGNTKVNYDQKALEFGYQAITFYTPEGLQFRYRLEGLEKEWNHSDNHLQNSVKYASLPAGKYRFNIQARLNNGEWSPLAASPTVEVAPPFYTRWWFLALTALGVGLIGYTTNSLISHRFNEKRLRNAIEEKKAQVEQSESRFQAIWESMDSGMLVLNEQAKILMVNPSFYRLFRCTPEAVVGNELNSIIEHYRLSQAFISGWFQNPVVLKFEIDTTAGGFPLHLLVTFSPLKKLGSTTAPLLIIGLKDISEKKEAEVKNLRLSELLVRQNRDLVKKELELASFNQELLSRQTELQETLRVLEERNYELDQFVYKTSHDLRAPIASALGLLNIMRMEGASPSWPSYIDMIIRSLEKQDNFIKAMLNFSKTARATDNPEPIEFESLIEQCLNDLQYLQGFDDIQKRVRVKSHEAGFYSDKMKIHIILSNILSNSIKYRDSAKASRLDIGVDIELDQARITISDNGIGINKAYLKSIFDMFYRATERSDGSGLGLYIVRQTVERLGGTIEVSSELGIGSSFKIIIPNRMPIAIAQEYLEQPNSETSTLG